MQPTARPRATRALWSATFALFATAAVSALLPSAAEAQVAPQSNPEPVILHACYVPASGTVYRIRVPGAPQNCQSQQHVEFSWTDGAAAVRTGTAAGGDLSGTYPNPTVSRLQGQAVSSATPSDLQFLQFDATGNEWRPASPAVGGDLTGTLSNASVIALRGSPVASSQPASGMVLGYAHGAWRPRVINFRQYWLSRSIGTASTAEETIYCPVGSQLTGGGVSTSSGDTKVRESAPILSGGGWYARVRNDHAFEYASMSVWAICMTIETTQ